MESVDIDEIKRDNPQIDAEELDAFLEHLRNAPATKKQGRRIAPYSISPVVTELPWKTSGRTECSHRGHR